MVLHYGHFAIILNRYKNSTMKYRRWICALSPRFPRLDPNCKTAKYRIEASRRPMLRAAGLLTFCAANTRRSPTSGSIGTSGRAPWRDARCQRCSTVLSTFKPRWGVVFCGAIIAPFASLTPYCGAGSSRNKLPQYTLRRSRRSVGDDECRSFRRLAALATTSGRRPRHCATDSRSLNPWARRAREQEETKWLQ